MAGRFLLKKFSDIDLNDDFFDSLKKDYPGTVSSTDLLTGLIKNLRMVIQHLFLKMKLV